MQPWKEMIDLEGNRLVGITRVPLQKSICGSQECNLGSFIADAMVHEYIDKAEPGSWTYASIAFTNVGGIRTSLNKGGIIYYFEYNFLKYK